MCREEASHLRDTYGQDFAKEFDGWLAFLASAVEDASESTSADALKILEEVARERTQPVSSPWSYSWGRFWKANGLEMLRALLVVLSKRCPPWEFRISNNWFTLLGFIRVEIQAYYMIDRLNKRIIFNLFELDYPKPQQV